MKDYPVGICSDCGGAWFGSGQFDSLVRSGQEALDQIVALEPVGEHAEHAAGTAKCPICQLVLSSRKYEGVVPIHLSACYQCGGIFIDAQSIQTLQLNLAYRLDNSASDFDLSGGIAMMSDEAAEEQMLLDNPVVIPAWHLDPVGKVMDVPRCCGPGRKRPLRHLKFFHFRFVDELRRVALRKLSYAPPAKK